MKSFELFDFRTKCLCGKYAQWVHFENEYRIQIKIFMFGRFSDNYFS